MQLEPDWPALAMERGTLFGVRDALGYNPVQLPRYWDYIRARTELPVFYNAAVIDLPTERDVGLLGVRYLDRADRHRRRHCPGAVVDRAQGYDLVELDGVAARASRWCTPGRWWTRTPRPSRRSCRPGSIQRRSPCWKPTPGCAPESGRAAGRRRP